MIQKLRAWDKKAKVIRRVGAILFSKDEDVIAIDYYKANGDLKGLLAKDIILMQATGLQDKNGVDIYDGDILEVISQHDTRYISLVRYMIYNDYPAFDIVPPNIYFYESNVLSTIVSSDEETMKVIGNIYENPNLLEENQ